MTSLLKWGTPNAYDADLSTGLNSLTNASAATSGAIANGTDLFPLMDVSIILGSINPSGTPYLEVHVLPLLDDGVNYADRNAATLVGTVQINTGSSAKYAMLPEVPIPPGDFKLAVVNQSGVTLAASGNTVKTRRYVINLNA